MKFLTAILLCLIFLGTSLSGLLIILVWDASWTRWKESGLNPFVKRNWRCDPERRYYFADTGQKLYASPFHWALNIKP
jgi:hypothetical protein